MQTSDIFTLISALGGAGVVATLVGFIRDRRKTGVETRIAERTEATQIGLVSVQELEAKLGYLNRVISVLEQHNVRLEGDLDQQYAMNSQLNTRVRELMHRCDTLEYAVRKLCIEAGIDPEQYL